nr:unnamed protein product [Digitaria exilis]
MAASARGLGCSIAQLGLNGKVSARGGLAGEQGIALRDSGVAGGAAGRREEDSNETRKCRASRVGENYLATACLWYEHSCRTSRKASVTQGRSPASFAPGRQRAPRRRCRMLQPPGSHADQQLREPPPTRPVLAPADQLREPSVVLLLQRIEREDKHWDGRKR